ncbi:NIPSNAP family protein [Cesiribacter sp. SM1]|uniref:NIPSNAP family protein n=1 Tax=Cesiribacter sp. SM1 TaxID=2861196 RepID=UPI001CD80066|nr:NIPSNAP family protein [Cesiribacter sp. SM1]
MSTNQRKLILFSLCLLLLWVGSAVPGFSQSAKPSFYQLKIYHLNSNEQEARLDQYLQNAYLPALHRAGISKVGVFKPVEDSGNPQADTVQLVYVFIPFKAPEAFFKLDEALMKDKQFAAAARDYTDASPQNAPYIGFESVLMEAFTGMPGVDVPRLKSPKGDRIYELRNYEAATEKLHLNKVSMFNNGEIQIFDRLGFNAVFYGRVLAGTFMPSLMYMTSFENMQERDAKWKAFGDDPAWKKLSSEPQYEGNFKRADIYLLRATDYSDI